MGAALYDSQQRALLERFQRVILMLDGDAAGRRAAAEIAARLRPHCSLQVIHLASDTQPDQMSPDEIRHVLRVHHERWQVAYPAQSSNGGLVRLMTEAAPDGSRLCGSDPRISE